VIALSNRINDLTESLAEQKQATNEQLKLYHDKYQKLDTDYTTLKINNQINIEQIEQERKEKLSLSNQLKQLISEKNDLSLKNETNNQEINTLSTQLKRLTLSNEESKRMNQKLESLNAAQSNEIETLKNNLIQSNETIKEHEETILVLKNENEEIKSERDDCESMRLDSVKKHETQMRALNQNLANLRADLKVQNDKVNNFEANENMIKSKNLELEAKLSNCIDERNELAERCINAEKLSETSRLQNVELKRRYEDTQSALQELGREHQNLQIEIYKKSNYKWIDDTTVKNCNNCKGVFSVTNRKVDISN
jgi:chromosome segregation ATPase